MYRDIPHQTKKWFRDEYREKSWVKNIPLEISSLLGILEVFQLFHQDVSQCLDMFGWQFNHQGVNIIQLTRPLRETFRSSSFGVLEPSTRSHAPSPQGGQEDVSRFGPTATPASPPMAPIYLKQETPRITGLPPLHSHQHPDQRHQDHQHHPIHKYLIALASHHPQNFSQFPYLLWDSRIDEEPRSQVQVLPNDFHLELQQSAHTFGYVGRNGGCEVMAIRSASYIDDLCYLLGPPVKDPGDKMDPPLKMYQSWWWHASWAKHSQDPKTNNIHDFTMDFLIFYPGFLQSKPQSYGPRNGLKTAPPEKETRLRCRCFSAKGYDLNMKKTQLSHEKNKKNGLTFHHTGCEKKESLLKSLIIKSPYNWIV